MVTRHARPALVLHGRRTLPQLCRERNCSRPDERLTQAGQNRQVSVKLTPCESNGGLSGNSGPELVPIGQGSSSDHREAAVAGSAAFDAAIPPRTYFRGVLEREALEIRLSDFGGPAKNTSRAAHGVYERTDPGRTHPWRPQLLEAVESVGGGTSALRHPEQAGARTGRRSSGSRDGAT